MWNLSDLLIGTEPCCGFLPRCSKNQRGRGNDHHVLPTTYQMRPRLEPSKCGCFRNNSTFESCLQRTKVLWGSVFFRKWFSRYIKQFADWIGLEPCQKAAPNDQHFRGTWHFSYSQVGCAKESFSHSACHWLDIVTVPICLKMHKKYVYIYTLNSCQPYSISLLVSLHSLFEAINLPSNKHLYSGCTLTTPIITKARAESFFNVTAISTWAATRVKHLVST